MTPGPDETGGEVDVDVATNQIEGGDVSLPEKGTKEKPYDPEPNRDKVRGCTMQLRDDHRNPKEIKLVCK